MKRGMDMSRGGSEKVCASCGQVVDEGLLKCPECGGGVFAALKKPGLPESADLAPVKHEWWRDVFLAKKTLADFIEAAKRRQIKKVSVLFHSKQYRFGLNIRGASGWCFWISLSAHRIPWNIKFKMPEKGPFVQFLADSWEGHAPTCFRLKDTESGYNQMKFTYDPEPILISDLIKEIRHEAKEMAERLENLGFEVKVKRRTH